MKLIKYHRFEMVNSVCHIFALLLVILPMASCSGGKVTDGDISRIENCDSIPDPVKRLVRVVSENDSAGFAAMVSYPLSRPYPLRDIETPDQMRVYYPVMVDDSLKSMITGSAPEDWREYGWRGWSLHGGDYLWIDEDLYDVAYMSAREREMLDSLTSREMDSVETGFRKGWTPVMCLKGMDNGAVYRIDMSRTEKGAPRYRMLAYDSGSDLRALPAAVYEGHKETEGTARTSTYYFTSPDGQRVIFSPDIPDGTLPVIEFPDTAVTVTRAYWLDLTR